jgi:hypothetical protein
MNLQNSGAVCRENAYVGHRPRKRTIQYSATRTMESKTRGVLDTRRGLSSGAHSRDPVARNDGVGLGVRFNRPRAGRGKEVRLFEN